MITLIGMGSGTPESLTAQGLAALQNAGLILGAKRLLEQLPQGCTEHRKALYQPEDVLAALAADPEVDAALVYSGDTGSYSGAAQLLPGWAMPMCWWAKSWAGQRKRSCSARRRSLRKSSLQA